MFKFWLIIIIEIYKYKGVTVCLNASGMIFQGYMLHECIKERERGKFRVERGREREAERDEQRTWREREIER